jgi:hypothetical protein
VIGTLYLVLLTLTYDSTVPSHVLSSAFIPIGVLVRWTPLALTHITCSGHLMLLVAYVTIPMNQFCTFSQTVLGPHPTVPTMASRSQLTILDDTPDNIL